MELTIQFISQEFDLINEMCFDNTLLKPRFEITHVKSYLGQYHWVYSWDARIFYDSVIRISDMFDRSEADIRNTIAHECIHLYIRQNKIKDTRPHHGRVFNQIADRLNSDWGFHIARTDSVVGCGLRDKSKVKTYYIGCFKNYEGKYFCFKMNKNYLEYYKSRFEYSPRSFKNPFIFTSMDDKKYAHMRECRKGFWGKFISHEEFETLRQTENIFYQLQTLSAA